MEKITLSNGKDLYLENVKINWYEPTDTGYQMSINKVIYDIEAINDKKILDYTDEEFQQFLIRIEPKFIPDDISEYLNDIKDS